MGLIPGLGRSPGEGNGKPFQYSCLENPTDGRTWRAIVHGVTRVRHNRDVGLIPGLGQFPGEGNDSPLQCSCLENPMDRGAWWAVVHGVSKSQTQLSDNNNKAKESGAYPVWGCRGISTWPFCALRPSGMVEQGEGQGVAQKRQEQE